MTTALHRGRRRVGRGLLFFLLYWAFAPRLFWRFEYWLDIVESCAFGLVAALIPWRQGWRMVVGVGFFAIGIWQLVRGAGDGRVIVIANGAVSLLLAAGFLIRAWRLSRFSHRPLV